MNAEQSKLAGRNYRAVSLTLRLTIAVIIFGFLGWFLLAGLDSAGFVYAIRTLDLKLLLVSVMLAYGASLIASWRWKLLLAGSPISVWRLHLIQHTATAVHKMIPIRGVGMASQLAMLALHKKVSPESALVSISIKRLLDLLVVVAFIGVAVYKIEDLRSIQTYFLVAVAWAMFGWVVAVVVGAGGVRLLSKDKIGLARMFRRETLHVRTNPGRLFLVILATIGSRALMGLALWPAVIAFSADLSLLPVAAVGLAMLFVAGVIPGVPASIGVFEGAGVVLLGLLGVGHEQALAIAVAYHVATLLPTAVVTLVAFLATGVGPIWRSGRYAIIHLDRSKHPIKAALARWH